MVQFFCTEKLIGIIRDSRQVSVSLRRHNLRVMRTYFRRKFTFIDVLKRTLDHFSNNFFLIPEIEKTHKDRLLLIKYEDLKARNVEILKKIFEFIGVNFTQSMLKEIYCKNHFSKFEDGKFFRLEKSDEWREKINKNLLKECMTSQTGNLLDIFIILNHKTFIYCTLFEKVLETVNSRVCKGEQKSHQQGRAIVCPCLF